MMMTVNFDKVAQLANIFFSFLFCSKKTLVNAYTHSLHHHQGFNNHTLPTPHHRKNKYEVDRRKAKRRRIPLRLSPLLLQCSKKDL